MSPSKTWSLFASPKTQRVAQYLFSLVLCVCTLSVNAAIIEYSGGTVLDDAWGQDTLNLSLGGVLTVSDDAEIYRVQAESSSTLIMDSGFIASISMAGHSMVDFSGGTISSILLSGYAMLDYAGGYMNSLTLTDWASVNLIGDNIQLSVEYVRDRDRLAHFVSGATNGQSWDFLVNIPTEYQGSASIFANGTALWGPSVADSDSAPTDIPEPPLLLLFASTFLLMFRCRFN